MNKNFYYFLKYAYYKLDRDLLVNRAETEREYFLTLNTNMVVLVTKYQLPVKCKTLTSFPLTPSPIHNLITYFFPLRLKTEYPLK